MLRVLRPARGSARGTVLRAALPAAVCLAALSLTGCASDTPNAGPTTGAGAPSDPTNMANAPSNAAPATTKPATPHNQADIAFASSMVPHHVQVLAATQIASTKAVEPQLRAFAGKLSSGQVPQIEAMSSWLANWGQPVNAGGVAPGGVGISQAELTKLSSTAGAGFDQLWLTTMIKQQQAALSLAQTELKSGTAAEAKALAKKIVAEQQSEIATMKALLAKTKAGAGKSAVPAGRTPTASAKAGAA